MASGSSRDSIPMHGNAHAWRWIHERGGFKQVGLRIVEMIRQLALEQIARSTKKLHELDCHVHCGDDCPEQGKWWCVCGVDRVTTPHEETCWLVEEGCYVLNDPPASDTTS